MATSEDYARNGIPLLRGKYALWKMRMMNHIKSLGVDVWKSVVEGFILPDDEVASNAEERKKANNDAKALNAIVRGLDDNDMVRIANCETSKEAWDKLQSVYEGNVHVKEARLQVHRAHFESLKMDKDENVEGYMLRVHVLVNSIRGLGEPLSDAVVTKKILRTLLPKFDSKVCAIEEAKDSEALTIDDLYGSLIAYEMRIQEDTPLSKQAVFQAQSKMQTGEKNAQGKRLRRKCFRCGSFRHMVAKCPYNEEDNESDEDTSECSEQDKRRRGTDEREPLNDESSSSSDEAIEACVSTQKVHYALMASKKGDKAELAKKSGEDDASEKAVGDEEIDMLAEYNYLSSRFEEERTAKEVAWKELEKIQDRMGPLHRENKRLATQVAELTKEGSQRSIEEIFALSKRAETAERALADAINRLKQQKTDALEKGAEEARKLAKAQDELKISKAQVSSIENRLKEVTTQFEKQKDRFRCLEASQSVVISQSKESSKIVELRKREEKLKSQLGDSEKKAAEQVKSLEEQLSRTRLEGISRLRCDHCGEKVSEDKLQSDLIMFMKAKERADDRIAKLEREKEEMVDCIASIAIARDDAIRLCAELEKEASESLQARKGLGVQVVGLTEQVQDLQVKLVDVEKKSKASSFVIQVEEASIKKAMGTHPKKAKKKGSHSRPNHPENKQSKRSNSSNYYSFYGRCFKCNEVGHRIRDCLFMHNAAHATKPSCVNVHGTCYACGEFGHRVMECPIKQPKQTRSVPVYYECEKPGHIAKECSYKMAHPGKDRRCYTCGQLGHIAKVCKQKKRQEPTCNTCGNPGHVMKVCKIGDLNSFILQKVKEHMAKKTKVQVAKEGSKEECSMVTQPKKVWVRKDKLKSSS